MAPARSPSLSQSAQSQKKQQSISSFFTAKSAPAPKPTPRTTTPSSNPNDNGRDYGDSLFVSDNENLGDSSGQFGHFKRKIDFADTEAVKPQTSKRRKLSLQDNENEEPVAGDLRSNPPRLSENTLSRVAIATPGASAASRRYEAPPLIGPEPPRSPYNDALPRDASPPLARADVNVDEPKKPARLSGRTSKYLFSSPRVDEDAGDEDEQVRRYKESMHQKFVKKLGKPDSIADIKRRNHFITEETEEADAEDGAEEEEDTIKPAKGKKGSTTKKAGNKLTPMLRQVLDIKRKNMETLIVVEVGYKYRFFGEDARVAAKELGIMCIPGKFRYDEHPSEAHIDRFASASFPTHRLQFHVKRLVQAGHKVGVVRQLETAALKKVGDNRNTPFVRELTNLYTKGTYIDNQEGLDGPVAGPDDGASSTGHLLCITETNAKGWGSDEKVRIGFIAVQPTTGDVIYDDFEDGFMRSELETRLLHIAPCELLIVGDVSSATEKLVAHLSGSKSTAFGDMARVERIAKPKTFAAQAYSHISSFYADKMKTEEPSEDSSALLDKVHRLSEHVTVCLSAMITHLTNYGLEHVFDLTKYFQSFSARSHMLLNGNTLTSLEIYRNQTDHTEKGSLFWTLDRTHTRFGQRLLRKWVGRPLLDRIRLKERAAAVEELMDSDRTIGVDRIKKLLRQIRGDLERSLIRIYYKKCAMSELVTVLQTLQLIANEFAYAKSPQDSGFESTLIGEAIASLPLLSEEVVSYLDRINLEAARNDNKYSFFRDEHETEAITDHNVAIVSIEHDLKEHKAVAAEKLRRSKIDYVTVAGIEYLIEVENTQLNRVPASWAKISGTKKMSRFHTPEVIKLIRERDQHKEALANACDEAFTALLTEIGSKYQLFRDCVQSLATLDCLLSLAEIAGQPGYAKPEFTSDDETCIHVEGGRHPMVEQILLDSYVPNDVSLSSSSTRALLITGPNMGGKSSYVRSVALIAIMAQIGSYVPATHARLSLLDAVFTRMGAFDNMMKGESTFMVELSETADILKQSTPRSLVILDELGRGTSTHDGVAIAQAVLDHLVKDTKALILFITHYQTLARMSDEYEDGRELRNVHMRFTEQRARDGESEVTFLYEVGEGTAHRSYGLNVARLAGLPKSLLDLAAVKSRDMEGEERKRRLSYLGRMLPTILDSKQGDSAALEALVAGIKQI